MAPKYISEILTTGASLVKGKVSKTGQGHQPKERSDDPPVTSHHDLTMVCRSATSPNRGRAASAPTQAAGTRALSRGMVLHNPRLAQLTLISTV